MSITVNQQERKKNDKERTHTHTHTHARIGKQFIVANYENLSNQERQMFIDLLKSQEI